MYSNGATADISPDLKACPQKYWPVGADKAMPKASTQPHRSGQRHTRMGGTVSRMVEKIANWVRIMSGVSESDSRFTSRIEIETAAALANATSAPSCRL